MADVSLYSKRKALGHMEPVRQQTTCRYNSSKAVTMAIVALHSKGVTMGIYGACPAARVRPVMALAT